MKYSIILPTLNAVQYLPNCVETIVSQDYDDYELIISNNCSDDGTAAYLKTLEENAHIKVIQPKERLPLGEHWNFAIAHARGEWLFGIGSDDGVMPYFFEILDKLTENAKKNNLKIIKCSRAYYFWEGLAELYGNAFITYYAKPDIKILSTKEILYKVLYADPSFFFDLPQMYTTAIFHRSIIEKSKNNKTGKIIQDGRAHDISLGVIGCLCENYYLYCDIPFGWVGSSSTSIGSCVAEHTEKLTINSLHEYINNHKDIYYNNYIHTDKTINSGNLFLASNIQNLLKNDYTQFQIPDFCMVDKEENILKLLQATYYDIISSKKNLQFRLHFFWDLLEHKNISKEFFLEYIQQKFKSTTIKKKVSLLLNIPRKILGKIRRLMKKTLYVEIVQKYDDPERFDNMFAVNNWLLNNPKIKKMLNTIK